MVETYLKERRNLRLVILILDIRRDPAEEDIDLLHWLDFYHLPVVVVLTKIDKLSTNQIKIRERAVRRCLNLPSEVVALILFSAKTGEGKDVLWSIIEKLYG